MKGGRDTRVAGWRGKTRGLKRAVDDMLTILGGAYGAIGIQYVAVG